MSQKYAIELLLLQGQVTTQYYVSTGTDNQVLLEISGSNLFNNIVKIDKIVEGEKDQEVKATETVYINEGLTAKLNLARLDYYKQIEDDEKVKEYEGIIDGTN
jgi:hypothetical protein